MIELYHTYMNKLTTYLPSKRFSIIIGIMLIVVIVFFSIFYFSKKYKYNSKESLTTEKATVSELVKKDTDGDGVADWEEALWGTDQNKKETFDGNSDLVYINNKKKSLNITEGIASNDNLTETDKFSRGFFASFVAMKQAGTVDSTTINNFSSALGQKIATPSLIDQYKIEDIKTKEGMNDDERKDYYLSVATLYDTYKESGLGDELGIVSGNLTNYSSTGKESSSDELLLIADKYQEFGQKLMEIKVPKDLAQYHLNIANASNNTGIAVRNMVKIISDPVAGLTGLSEYQKYREDLEISAKAFEATFIKNDIINGLVN